MLAPIRSYVFRQNIPPKGAVKIEVQGRAQKPGSFLLKLDVCVKTALVSSSFELGTVTVQQGIRFLDSIALLVSLCGTADN
jgi:hypothetical protein